MKKGSLPLNASDDQRINILYPRYDGTEGELEIQLGRGNKYRFVIQNELQKSALISQLLSVRHSQLVASRVGLISNLRIWENILLPGWYHGYGEASALQKRSLSLLRKCGVNKNLVGAILNKMPDQLSGYERLLGSFVRTLLLKPSLIVFESISDGLTHQDVKLVSGFEDLFIETNAKATSVRIELKDSYFDDASSLIYL